MSPRERGFLRLPGNGRILRRFPGVLGFMGKAGGAGGRSTPMNLRTTRRQFLGSAAAAPLLLSGAALGADEKPAASNRITLGVIGTGNQGFNDIASFLGDERVQIVAVCDVNRESAGYWDGEVGGREPGKRLVEEHYAADKKSGKYKGCDAYADFRELLGRKDIDAV